MFLLKFNQFYRLSTLTMSSLKRTKSSSSSASSASSASLLTLSTNKRAKSSTSDTYENSCTTNTTTTEMSPTTKKHNFYHKSVDRDSLLLIKKLNLNAQLPKRGSASAAGYDLYSSEDTMIPARGRGVAKTGLAIRVPYGTYGRVAPRSGLSVKFGIETGAGVVDRDYRGEVGVVLFNHEDKEFEIKKGDRIAQLVLEKIVTPEIEIVDELDVTVRGSGKFGSTGTR